MAKTGKPMGRPKTVVDYGVVLSTRIPTPRHDEFRRIAQERGITPSDLLREIIYEWFAGQAGQTNEGEATATVGS